MKSFVSINLLIYLKSDVPNLVKKKSIKEVEITEASISIEYLSKLNEKYEKWISNYNEGKLFGNRSR